MTPEDEQKVLCDMIDSLLLAQAAARNGFIADEALVDQRLAVLVARLGSQDALNEWMAANGYREDEFRQALRSAIQAAWQRDQITGGVPKAAEQTHARQILLSDEAQANEVLSRLQAGADFARLAFEYDPTAGGELGWFLQGYLLYPELEAAIATLQPGQYSAAVQTQIGYHILQVIERQADRPLSPDALLQAQNRALQRWLEEARSQGAVEILVP